MNKKDVIKILEEIGTLLEIKGENPFKARAYYNAARQLEILQGDLEELVRTGRIKELKGIGDALAKKIETLVTTGSLPYYEELKASVPEGLLEMRSIPGMGPKKIKTIYEKLGITTIGELEYACLENRLRDLPGFGQKTQEKILKGIELRKKYKERFYLPVARETAETLVQYLAKSPLAQKITVAGSLRRFRETIKDVDILVACNQNDGTALGDYFASFPEIDTITGKGPTKVSVILKNGMACDLRIVSPESFPFALQYFTGSKDHNTALRHRARQKGFTLNEYGLFKLDGKTAISCQDEKALYRALGLDFIEPELRENFGELEAAEEGRLPRLVQASDLKGVLHVHTTYSDGSQSIETMARKCMELGFSYLGITDHSKSAYYANGLSEERIKQQHEEIERLNELLKPFKIFKGIEVDILPDGSLDYDDSVLETFDFIIASVHSSFKLPENEMTARICKALSHPLVTMLGHPTGRLLLARESYALNMEKVLETAAKHQKVIEINANPYRLDLDWRWGIKAKQMGIKTSVNPDAHSLEGLEDIAFGVGIARKAWFEPEDVINTYDREAIAAFFQKNK